MWLIIALLMELQLWNKMYAIYQQIAQSQASTSKQAQELGLRELLIYTELNNVNH